MPLALPDGWSLWWLIEQTTFESWLVRREGSASWFEASLLHRDHVYDDLLWDEQVAFVAERCRLAQHGALPRVTARLALDTARLVITERVGGLALDALLASARRGATPLRPSDAARIVGSVADGLARLYADVGYVHGNLHTSHIRVTASGSAVLRDPWRLSLNANANVTGRTSYAPRFNYMAPEIVKGLPRDPRADVYSLGVMLYEAVTGVVAYTAPSDFELLRRILDAAPLAAPRAINAAVPEALDAVIRRAISKRAEDRFAHTGELAAALAPWNIVEPAHYRASSSQLFERYATPLDRAVSRIVDAPGSLTGGDRRSLWRALRETLLDGLSRGRDDADAVIALTELRDEAAADLRALQADERTAGASKGLIARLLTGALIDVRAPRRVRLGAVEVETCPRAWSSLRKLSTEDDRRHCEACDEFVIRVDDTETLALSAGRACVSVRRFT
ncbi:MAG: protein kinase [Polyangiales bacterium]